MATRTPGSRGLVGGWAEGRRGGGGSRRPRWLPRPGAALRTRPLARASAGVAESPARPRPCLRRFLGPPGLEFVAAY